MIFRRWRSRPAVRRIPDGIRIYAIGDVHGRFDLLERLLDRVREDDAARPGAETVLIFLGDLMDRGPDSRQVIERARALCADGGAQLIKGNHEEIFISAAHGDAKAARALVRMGGVPTLLSYGLTQAEIDAGSYDELAALIAERVPKEHVDFLDKGRDMITFGDYVFVHAGIRPGRALGEQSTEDLRWIRHPFLDHGGEHGVIVVHGHTPTPEVDERANRIGIDTGAFKSGVLTALALDGGERWFVQVRDDA